MAINLLGFLTPWTLFLGALVVVVVVIIVLTIIERKLNKKVVEKKYVEDSYFERQLVTTRSMKNNPKKFLESLDGISRQFFEERYGLSINLGSSELIKFLKNKNNSKAVVFFKRMQSARYSGDALDDAKLESLLKNLQFLISNENQKTKVMSQVIAKKDYWKKDVEFGFLKKMLAKKQALEENRQDASIAKPEVKPIERPVDEVKMELSNEWKNGEIPKIEESVLQIPKGAAEERIDVIKYLNEKEEIENRRFVKERDSDDIYVSEPSELEVVPVVKEKIISKSMIRRRNGRIPNKSIESVDNYDRIKRRIRVRKNQWAIPGIAIE